MNQLLERIWAAWDNLSGRERGLVSAAGGLTVLALVWAIVIQPIVIWVDQIDQRVETAEAEYQAMVRLRREYDVVEASLSTVEERIHENQEQRNLLTLLEALARDSSVKVDSMEERKAQDDVKFKETKVEVRLKMVTLADTVRYLHAIEDSDRLLTVKSLSIKNRADHSNLLDVKFSVSTFDPL